MNWSVTSLSYNLTKAVFSAIVLTAPDMTPQAVSNVLYSLARIGFSWKLIPVETQVAMLKALSRLAFQLNEAGVSTILYALGVMTQQQPQPHGFEVSRSLLDALSAKSSSMAHHELANSLHGLGRLSNIHCNDLLRSKLLFDVSKICNFMTEQELGNSVWGLGRIGTDFSVADDKDVSPIYEAIADTSSDLQRQGLLAILQGLSNRGSLYWRRIPLAAREALLCACQRILETEEGSTIEKAKLSASVILSMGIECDYFCRLITPIDVI